MATYTSAPSLLNVNHDKYQLCIKWHKLNTANEFNSLWQSVLWQHQLYFPVYHIQWHACKCNCSEHIQILFCQVQSQVPNSANMA